jgi:hypothetical protein
VEYVALAATGTVLSFAPGEAAFAPLFEPGAPERCRR